MASPSVSAPRVVVIGGGVIGLGCALALAEGGADVVVLERDVEGGQASRAAGGMLAPLGEARDADAFLDFALTSLTRWPAWAESVERAAAMPIGFRRCGKLLVAFDDAEAAALRDRARWQQAAGHQVRLTDGDGARELEPALSDGVVAALHLPTDAQVDNPLLHRALEVACATRGVTLHHEAPVAGLRIGGGRTVGVTLHGGGAVDADVVVLAAGAWSGGLDGLPTPVPVRPVRGQMLRFALDTPLLDGLVASPGAYLIPRDHALVVGASQEDAGFEVTTDAATLEALRAAAVRMVPALARHSPAESWAGLRPATPDGLPILGADPRVTGLIHATGHFRNGILLAPATADAVRALVLDGPGAPGHPAAAFSPGRFA